MKPAVYTNQNEALIVWRYPQPIPDCVGFAIYKRVNAEPEHLAQPLKNRVGFADEKYTIGEERPSTQWPFQRFIWSDYTVHTGEEVQYRIVPMLLQHKALVEDLVNISEWSDAVTVGTSTPYEAFFNRGLVASQFFSRANTDIIREVAKVSETVGDSKTGPSATNSAFKKVIHGGPGKLRDFLGGCLAAGLFKVLDEAIEDKECTVYAALYELKLDDLTDRLVRLGKRANVILANGTGKTPKELPHGFQPLFDNDENTIARSKLKGKINLFDRIVNTSEHFAHNKFMVICKKGAAQKVLTGTTNWTPDGLFAQVNNSILINDPKMANEYLEEWKQIKAAGNDYPESLYSYNEKPKVASPVLKAWCNPLHGLADLKDIEAMLTAAKQGFLFLLFNPGPKDTVYNTILHLIQTREQLFIRGVMNQDPGKKGEHLVFFNLKDKKATNWEVILPKRIKDPFAFWYPDVSDGLVTIHSKSYVIDPFGDDPVVITGSNNGGPKASGKNDDNFVVIKNKKLASEYATNILSVYAHYKWRYSLVNKASGFKGLQRDPAWMKKAMTADLAKELKFLLH